MNKQSLRLEYLNKRRQMNVDEVQPRSDLIMQKLQSLIDWPTVRSVHVYNSQAALKEVDTSGIVDYLRIHWPQIEVTVGNASPTAPLPFAKYDLIIVPVVAFDAQRNRLGFGGGWYDRFLASQPQAITIGLAYDFQQTDVLSVDSHDVRLSQIITNMGVVQS